MTHNNTMKSLYQTGLVTADGLCQTGGAVNVHLTKMSEISPLPNQMW